MAATGASVRSWTCSFQTVTRVVPMRRRYANGPVSDGYDPITWRAPNAGCGGRRSRSGGTRRELAPAATGRVPRGPGAGDRGRHVAHGSMGLVPAQHPRMGQPPAGRVGAAGRTG